MRTFAHATLGLAVALTLSACDGGPVEPASAPIETVLAAQGAQSSQPISGTFEFTGFEAPGSVRRTKGGTLHLRDFLGYQAIHGDLEGTGTYLQNANVNPNSTGSAHGFVDLTVTWNGLTGRISGNTAASALNGWFTGSHVLHGEGELAGHKFRIYFEGPAGGPFNYTGNVVTPASAN